jgi:hypothetical protein
MQPGEGRQTMGKIHFHWMEPHELWYILPVLEVYYGKNRSMTYMGIEIKWLRRFTSIEYVKWKRKIKKSRIQRPD